VKKCLCLLLLCSLLLSSCGGKAPEAEPSDELKIVATIFPAYDFARAAAGDLADVELLLPPGTESHSYEPTPADILAVQECDLFVYLGGESDTWVETILESIEMRGTALRMIDCVELLEEEHVEGMQMAPGHSHDHDGEACHEEHHHEEEESDHPGLGEVVGMDEHVWTSPVKAAEITVAIGEQLAELDEENAERYIANAMSYSRQISDLDVEFRAFFEDLLNRTIVFGDRFPLRYFAEEYDLDYYAAFPGCGTQTEPSAATVAFLTGKVMEEKLPAIWYIEFSNHLVADSIAEAAGVETAMFHTCHNVSKAELEAGATYVSLMENNLETLKNYM